MIDELTVLQIAATKLEAVKAAISIARFDSDVDSIIEDADAIFDYIVGADVAVSDLSDEEQQDIFGCLYPDSEDYSDTATWAAAPAATSEPLDYAGAVSRYMVEKAEKEAAVQSRRADKAEDELETLREKVDRMISVLGDAAEDIAEIDDEFDADVRADIEGSLGCGCDDPYCCGDIKITLDY